MLIEFSVENFRSFRERVTLSMIAANLRSTDEQLDRDNVIAATDKLGLLRSAIIYGANASGKSNVIKAVEFMRGFVLNSAGLRDEEVIAVEPFRLDTTGTDKPSTFEIVFQMDGLQYRYGFSLTSSKVVEEWLYYIPTLREVRLFTRNAGEFLVGSHFREGRGLQHLNLDNKLFLSAVAQFKKSSSFARRVREWFQASCQTLTAIDDAGYLPYTMTCIEEDRYAMLEEFVRRLDLDVVHLSVTEVPMPPTIARLEDAIRGVLEGAGKSVSGQRGTLGQAGDRTTKQLQTSHLVRDEHGMEVDRRNFPALEMESEGTQKLIALAGPLLDVLTNGLTLFLDEIDSRLHPLITTAILRLFNSPASNPKNAQVICTTHDTNLLDRHLFRRDQVFFVEKDARAVSHLYSLADFKLKTPDGKARSVRSDATYERDYIQGRYGAIPYVGDLHRLFTEEVQKAL